MRMRFAILLIGLLCGGVFWCEGASGAEADFNALILKALKEMPSGGGYSVQALAMDRLVSSSVVRQGMLRVEPKSAQPSFCSSATYLAFIKALEMWAERTGASVPEAVWQQWLPVRVQDGVGVWGRWNANGPGTAVLLKETGMGVSFVEKEKAVPGDFLKVFWNERLGSTERGHSVVFLGFERGSDGHERVKYWSSNQGVGYGEKTADVRRIARMLFSRVTAPEGVVSVARLAPKNGYLQELLKRASTEREAADQIGLKAFPVEKAYDAGFKESASVAPDAGKVVEAGAVDPKGSGIVVAETGQQVGAGEFPLAGWASVVLPRAVRGGGDGGPRMIWCPAISMEPETGVVRKVGSVEEGVWMGDREVTQGEWERVMGSGIEEQSELMLRDDTIWGEKRMREWQGFPEDAKAVDALRGKGDALPVYYVSGDEARDYCRRLTDLEREAGRLPSGWEYRLPREDEWESVYRMNGRGSTRSGEGVDAGEGAVPGVLGLLDLDANVSEMCEPVKGGEEISGSLGVMDVFAFGQAWNVSAAGGVAGGDAQVRAVSNPLPKGFRLGNVGFRLAMGKVRGKGMSGAR